MEENDFRKHADAAITELNRSLIEAEAESDFEVEERGGAIHISFEQPEGRFVVSPNAPVRQIWISALSTSFKLDWSDTEQDFVLPRTGEKLKPLMSRLINEQMGSGDVELK